MKNKILYSINMVAIFFLMLFVSCMDSEDIAIPTIGIVICISWLLIDALIEQEIFNEEKT